jgi:hypothetical protein
MGMCPALHPMVRCRDCHMHTPDMQAVKKRCQGVLFGAVLLLRTMHELGMSCRCEARLECARHRHVILPTCGDCHMDTLSTDRQGRGWWGVHVLPCVGVCC